MNNLYTKHVNLLFESIQTESEVKESEGKSIITSILNELKLGMKMVFIFGAGIGAFVGPVNDILNNEGISMSKEDVGLLLIASFAILLRESPELIDKVKEKLKEKGLLKHLGKVSDFINKSKKLVSVVAEKVGKVAHSVSDILGFTFLLVPTMKMVGEVINDNHITSSSLGEFITGLSIAVGVYGFKSVLGKVLSKKGDKPYEEKVEESYQVVSGGKIECPICDWGWEIESDDERPYLCHQCGYDSKLKDFDVVSLNKWEDDTTIKNVVGSNLPLVFDFSSKNTNSKIDTGAVTNSIHCPKFFVKNGVLNCMLLDHPKPITFDNYEIKTIKSSNGLKNKRYCVKLKFKIGGQPYESEFTLNDRSNMEYPVLIGKNFLNDNNFLVDVSKPYEEKVEEGYHIRTFSEDTNEDELVWHRDKEDRIVESIGDTDWMIQLDNQIPKPLTEKVSIPKNTYHRVIKGSGDLKVRIKKS